MSRAAVARRWAVPREIADIMVEAVTSDLAAKSGANVLAFVNGMGGTPLLELYLLYGEVDKRLRALGLNPVRNLVGSYITSLEMAGRRSPSSSSTTTSLHCGTRPCTRLHFAGEADAIVAVAIAMDAQTVTAWMNEIAASVRAERDYLVQLDAAIGDGDHGINLNRGFDAVTLALSTEPDGTPGKLLILSGKTLVSTVGGASGPLWGSALRKAGRALGDGPTLRSRAAGRRDGRCAGVDPGPRRRGAG